VGDTVGALLGGVLGSGEGEATVVNVRVVPEAMDTALSTVTVLEVASMEVITAKDVTPAPVTLLSTCKPEVLDTLIVVLEKVNDVLPVAVVVLLRVTLVPETEATVVPEVTPVPVTELPVAIVEATEVDATVTVVEVTTVTV